ncbi:MAG: GNAT family N-acetyltransferase [Clostridia bacterium]
MKAVYLEESMTSEFIEYCRRHCREHDESFVPKDDFRADSDNPTYVLLEEGEVKGAVSLMITPELKKQNRGRFRIIHSTLGCFEAYKLMMETILQHAEGLDYVTLYVPEGREQVTKYVKDLGFEVQRYSWYMEKQCINTPVAVFPPGYSLRPLGRGRDEQQWCDVTNNCFASNPGHADMTVEMFLKELGQEDYIEGGVMLLYFEDKPVGAIRVSRDYDDMGELAFITYVSITKEHRNKGLGKKLLRKALEFSIDKGFSRAGLVVSAENPSATRLYLGEGFEKLYTVACYIRHIYHES